MLCKPKPKEARNQWQTSFRIFRTGSKSAHPSTYGAISADAAVSSGHAGARHSHRGETKVAGGSAGLGGASEVEKSSCEPMSASPCNTGASAQTAFGPQAGAEHGGNRAGSRIAYKGGVAQSEGGSTSRPRKEAFEVSTATTIGRGSPHGGSSDRSAPSSLASGSTAIKLAPCNDATSDRACFYVGEKGKQADAGIGRG
eukprot:1377532-Pleurochrysis_carterae.AAC.6